MSGYASRGPKTARRASASASAGYGSTRAIPSFAAIAIGSPGIQDPVADGSPLLQNGWCGGMG
jgi:hypothetical protein